MTKTTIPAKPLPVNTQKSVSALEAAVEADRLRWLRLAVYAYFGLWLIEGALRKWILPGLSGPLLIIRDPVLMFIYGAAIWQKVFKLNSWLTFILILSMLSTVVSFGLFKPPPWYVIVFGFHANFLHLPLIFLLPQIINYTDVKKFGAIILWMAPPMAVLVALQFLSGADSRWNVGAGSEGKMIETAFGRIRPSGTFSFTNGLAEYTALLTAFLLHHTLEQRVFSRVAFTLAAPGLLVLVVMSGSRTTFALVALQLMAVAAIWIIKPRFMKSSVKLIAIGFLVVAVIGSIGALRMGVDVILERFSSSGGVKEGFIIRFIDEFKKPIEAAAKAEIGGVGIGMGTNAASSVMYKMLRFNLGESELDRVVMEMGPILGLAYLLWRFGVVFHIFRAAVSALKIKHNTLPLLLITACANDVIQGQFGQTTVMGFAALCAGLALSATLRRDEADIDVSEKRMPLNAYASQRPMIRPSPYAVMLRDGSPTITISETPGEAEKMEQPGQKPLAKAVGKSPASSKKIASKAPVRKRSVTKTNGATKKAARDK